MKKLNEKGIVEFFMFIPLFVLVMGLSFAAIHKVDNILYRYYVQKNGVKFEVKRCYMNKGVLTYTTLSGVQKDEMGFNLECIKDKR